MAPEDYEALIASSFEDHRLSRAERQELGAAFAAIDRDEDRAQLRRQAFDLVRGALGNAADAPLLDWLDGIVKSLYHPTDEVEPDDQPEAWFSPSQDCARRIVQLFEHAKACVDVCVFTITDDRITRALLEAHDRGVIVRVLTDDAKAEDLGSDIERIRQSRILTRADHGLGHMHHKFAIFDRARLLTGSYNWTLGAARDNQENFVVTSDKRLVATYSQAFEGLWERLGRS